MQPANALSPKTPAVWSLSLGEAVYFGKFVIVISIILVAQTNHLDAVMILLPKEFKEFLIKTSMDI